MIGGCDIVLNSSYLTEDLIHHAAAAILGIWTEGVIEDAGVENKLLKLPELLGGNYKEVFVYQDIDAHASWTRHGWTRNNCTSMIHLLAYFDTGTLTCVLENPDNPELKSIIEAIQIMISKREQLPDSL